MHLQQLIHQKSYEKIELVLRRHPLTFVPQVALLITLLLVPLALYLLDVLSFPLFQTNEKLYAIFVLAASGFYLLAYIFFFTQFIDYYLDIWIITNDRIIDMEQLGLFRRTISELDLFRIQDVTTEVKGIFATFFDYGNVSVQTASQNLGIVFYNVPHPNRIRRTLLHLADVDRKFHLKEGDTGVDEE